MHHCIFINHENVPASSLSYSIADYTSLKDFTGKTIYIGLEWPTPIAASDVNVDLKFDLDYPNGLMLVLTNITSYNQATSWNGTAIFWRCSRATPVPATMVCVMTPRTCKRPHCQSFHTATIFGLVVPSTSNSYLREP